MSDFLGNPDLKLIIFGGKGGCGKTTSAAATALHFSKIKPESRILVVSTDPAHSLGDSLNIEIGNKITPVAKNVWGYEIDAQKLLVKYKAENAKVIKKIAERGTFFDSEDIENFFVVSLPGLDEVMAIIEISKILGSGEYDIIVLDTAPTGHTIALLSLPEKMQRWVEVVDLMIEKHRYIAKKLVGRYIKDDCDEFLESQREDVNRVKILLTDSEKTEFVPVTIPEVMSINEIEKLIVVLKEDKISVRSIIVNRISMADNECLFCLSKKTSQKKYLEEIEKKFSSYNLVKIPLFSRQIWGIKDLKQYEEFLFDSQCKETFLAESGKDIFAVCQPTSSNISEESAFPENNMDNILSKNLKLVIFAGKGGVGKTSIASAAALGMARNNKDKKYLIFSTNPVHGLSDCFEQDIGNNFTLINGTDNLYALELNAEQMLDSLKEEYLKDIEEVFAKFSPSGMDLRFDRQVMEELIVLTPPGLEELMALKKIIEMMKNSDFDCFLMDPAASGHLLRFLETPDIVRDWLKTAFRLILKYDGIIKLSGIHSIETLLDLSKDVRKIQGILINPEITEVIITTIPEEMGVREMTDLVSAIRSLKISFFYTVINMIIMPSACGFCTSKREEQQRYVKQIKSKSDGTIIYIPLFLHDIRGTESLNKLAQIMFPAKQKS